MKAATEHISQIVPLLKGLWPELTAKEAEKILKDYMSGAKSAVFAEIIEDRFIGMALCSLRHDYVEGCHSIPVGYLEGIFIHEDYRIKGIARILCNECENWAKEMGCSEFASDCELTNTDSLRFHLSVGFQEENRIICFKKTL